jgi:hypothetical protein
MPSKSMLDKLKKLCVFTKSGPLIALAIAAGIVLGSARSHNAVLAADWLVGDDFAWPRREGCGVVVAAA